MQSQKQKYGAYAPGNMQTDWNVSSHLTESSFPAKQTGSRQTLYIAGLDNQLISSSLLHDGDCQVQRVEVGTVWKCVCLCRGEGGLCVRPSSDLVHGVK